MNVREARRNEIDEIHSIIEATMLELDPDLIQSILSSQTNGSVLVAVDSHEGPILGAIVVQEGHVVAIAVRPNRRGQGIGSELIIAAARRTDDPLTATFDPAVAPFYERLGFELEPIEETSRVRAIFSADSN